MTILEKIKEIKEQREVIKTVEEAKLKKQKPVIEKELEKEAKELAEELNVTFDEALIYIKNQKNKEHKQKISQERQERFGTKGKKILRGLEDWSARANQQPIIQPQKTEVTETEESNIQPKTKSYIEKPRPIPARREKPKGFFEVCKEMNK